MLGGSVWIALLRHIMGAALMMGVFFLLDRPRFSIKKTAVYYCVFGVFAAAAFCVWYLIDFELFVWCSGFATIIVVGTFCTMMSADFLYLSIYKVTLGFYLLSVTVFLGVDGSRLWFGSSLWADLALRAAAETVMLLFSIKKVRPRFQAGRDFLNAMMDLPSAITLVFMLMIAGVGAYWPDSHELSINRVVRIAVMLAMTGIIQWMTFRMYFYRGKEYFCRMEKELMEINELLLRRQLKLMKAEDLEVRNTKKICNNATVNKILSIYKTYADEENIQIEVRADMDEKLTIREFDIAAILVSVLENAIYECCSAGKEMRRINMVIQQNKNKIVLLCQNTCAPTLEQEGCPERWKDKMESIQKLIHHYNGEIEFSIENRMYISKILLDVTAREKQRHC